MSRARRNAGYRWEPEVHGWDAMTAEEKLLDVERVLQWVGHQLTYSNPARFEDTVQEGWVAAWRELCNEPDIPRAWLVRRAKFRMLPIAAGKERMTGSKMDANSWITPTVAYPEDEDGRSIIDNLIEDVRAAQHLEQVEMAQIEAEIRAAVKSLEQEVDRELVYLLFWEELNFGQAGKALGIGIDAATRRFSGRIRVALAYKLDHLKPERIRRPAQRHVWTDADDVRLIEMWGAGLTYAQMVEASGLSSGSLQRHAARLGLSRTATAAA